MGIGFMCFTRGWFQMMKLQIAPYVLLYQRWFGPSIPTSHVCLHTPTVTRNHDPTGIADGGLGAGNPMFDVAGARSLEAEHAADDGRDVCWPSGCGGARCHTGGS